MLYITNITYLTQGFTWVNFILDTIWGGTFSLGLYYIVLYFYRKQRDHSLVIYGLSGIICGLRLSQALLQQVVTGKLYLFLCILSYCFLILSLNSINPNRRWTLIIFILLSLTALMEMGLLSLNNINFIRISFIIYSIVLTVIIFIHIFYCYKYKLKIRHNTLYISIFIMLSIISLIVHLFNIAEAVIISEIASLVSLLIINLVGAKHIAHYFSEVEDLTYNLKVSNISLKKSEELIKQKNYELHHQANHDFLTELPNRMSLYHMAKKTLDNNYNKNHKVGLILLDLDKFKQLNDTMGHKTGDLLLTNFAQKVRSILRSSDQFFRLGGDEFTIMVTEIHNQADLKRVVNKIYKELEAPLELGDIDYRVSCSMGVALFPDNGGNIDSLLAKADMALYSAKDKGRNRAIFFDNSIQGKSDKYYAMSKKLSESLQNNEFFLHFQPQFKRDNDWYIWGFEALVRLEDGYGGYISPTEFIPIAEDSGFILPLGAWILDRACKLTKPWIDMAPHLKISVNVSASQFRSETFISDLFKILKKRNFPAKNLVLELTENLAMNNDNHTIKTIELIRKSGIEISIDDFGTGFSSINYLKQFPLDHIKIDKCFIDDITNSNSDKVIVSSIINMAISLGMDVIAEGVELTEQLIFLNENGCNIIQGYLMSKPLEEKDARILLKKEINQNAS